MSVQPWSPLIIVCWADCLLESAEPADFLPHAKHTIVCFVDSITGVRIYGQMMQDLTDRHFPERGITVLSRIISDDRAAPALARVGRDVIAGKPDWVLIDFACMTRVKPGTRLVRDNQCVAHRWQRRDVGVTGAPGCATGTVNVSSAPGWWRRRSGSWR